MKYEPFDLSRALAGEPVVYSESEYKRYVMKHPLVDSYIIYSECGSAEPLSATGLGLYVKSMWPKEPLTLPDELWAMLDPSIVAVAKGKGKAWLGYKNPPLKCENGWTTTKGGFFLLGAVSHLFPDCDWKDSLILRPDNNVTVCPHCKGCVTWDVDNSNPSDLSIGKCSTCEAKLGRLNRSPIPIFDGK